MNLLVLHHHYARSAFDLSDNFNHGSPVAVLPTNPPSPNARAFLWSRPESIVHVAPNNKNESLQHLVAIRVIAAFNLSTGGPIARRYNLVEGHLSFALYVEPDGVLIGTVLDAVGNWSGAKSSTGLITTDAWHVAELRYDGINQVVLFLDGVEVASSYDAHGPVRSVGPNGIAIGHWPEPSGIYTFSGYMREVQLYKYDPHKDVNGLLDNCCLDRDALDRAVIELKRRGVTAETVATKAREIMEFALELQWAVRGGEEVISRQQQLLCEAAFVAFLRGDQAAYSDALAKLAVAAKNRISSQQLQELQQKRQRIIDGLPLPFEDLQKLIPALCWDRVGLDPKQFAEAVEQLNQRSKS